MRNHARGRKDRGLSILDLAELARQARLERQRRHRRDRTARKAREQLEGEDQLGLPLVEGDHEIQRRERTR